MPNRVATMAHDTWVLCPDAAPPPSGWPVLLFLHGKGEAAWTESKARPVVEHGPDALLAHGSPVALYRAQDARVATLWQRFALVAPQALNDGGKVSAWDWSDPDIHQRLTGELARLAQRGELDTQRLFAAGFSRGGRGCLRLDASHETLQFRKIVAVDAEGLDQLPAAVGRQREVRAYYAPSTHPSIGAAHVAAEERHGKAQPPVSIIARPQRGGQSEVHAAICREVFAEDELYRWLLA